MARPPGNCTSAPACGLLDGDNSVRCPNSSDTMGRWAGDGNAQALGAPGRALRRRGRAWQLARHALDAALDTWRSGSVDYWTWIKAYGVALATLTVVSLALTLVGRGVFGRCAPGGAVGACGTSAELAGSLIHYKRAASPLVRRAHQLSSVAAVSACFSSALLRCVGQAAWRARQTAGHGCVRTMRRS
jgi:hypothetical protein